MYTPSEKRYERMIYNRCGKSGLKLPAVSLGLWQNFGHKGNFSIMEQMPTIMAALTMAVRRKISVVFLTGECVSSAMNSASLPKPDTRCGTVLTVTATVRASI